MQNQLFVSSNLVRAVEFNVVMESFAQRLLVRLLQLLCEWCNCFSGSVITTRSDKLSFVDANDPQRTFEKKGSECKKFWPQVYRPVETMSVYVVCCLKYC